MKKIVFMGDSITDSYRPYEDDRFLGSGYPEFVKGELNYKYGDEYQLFNRGISGNRISDLYARIKLDAINLKPDYFSLLIGVNDVWHEIDYKNGISADKYEKLYELLIETVKEALPDIKIFILEPFVLEYTATENTEQIPDRWNLFNTGVRERAAVAKKVAEKYGLTFIPLQVKMEEEVSRLGIATVSEDGVHPTAAGHLIIAREWLKAFEDQIV